MGKDQNISPEKAILENTKPPSNGSTSAEKSWAMFLPRFSSLSRLTPLSFPPMPALSSSISLQSIRRFRIKSPLHLEDESSSSPVQGLPENRNNRWKPMCLYYTQDKCTKVIHSTYLSHKCSGLLL